MSARDRLATVLSDALREQTYTQDGRDGLVDLVDGTVNMQDLADSILEKFLVYEKYEVDTQVNHQGKVIRHFVRETPDCGHWQCQPRVSP